MEEGTGTVKIIIEVQKPYALSAEKIANMFRGYDIGIGRLIPRHVTVDRVFSVLTIGAEVWDDQKNSNS